MLTSQEHRRVSRETKANRNAGRRRRWDGLFVYGLEGLTPDAPDMRRKYAVFDTRFRGHTRPEIVTHVGAEAFFCPCQEALLGEGTDCPHISAVRSAITRYGPPSPIGEPPPAEEAPSG